MQKWTLVNSGGGKVAVPLLQAPLLQISVQVFSGTITPQAGTARGAGSGARFDRIGIARPSRHRGNQSARTFVVADFCLRGRQLVRPSSFRRDRDTTIR